MLKFHWKWSLEPLNVQIGLGEKGEGNRLVKMDHHVLHSRVSFQLPVPNKPPLSHFQHFPPETNARHSAAPTRVTLHSSSFDRLSQCWKWTNHTWVSELAEDVRGDGRVCTVEQKQVAEQKHGVVVQQSRSNGRGSNRLCSSRWNTSCHIRSFRWKRRMTKASSNSHHWYNSKDGP